MAGAQNYHSPHCNSLFGGKDELIKWASAEGSNIYTSISTMLHTFIPIPTPTLYSINKLFKIFIKAYFEN